MISLRVLWSERFHRIRIILASTTALPLALIIALTVRQLGKEPVLPMQKLGALAENESAVTLYYDFLGNLKSGKIVKTSYSTKSLYDLVSYTRETIVFSTLQNDKRVMTYQQRQPLVFWHYPDPNYYDGNYYYYKHNGDWFIDTFNRYQNQIQLDALGIPNSAISEYRITDSMVYHRPDGGYQAYVYAVSRNDASHQAELVGVLDSNFQFSYIEITVTYPANNTSQKQSKSKTAGAVAGLTETVTEKYIIEYEKVNNLIEITPPDSLTPDEILYLQKEFQQSQQNRRNAA